MKIPELKGASGDKAVYIKDDGRSSCRMRCFKKDEWYIVSITGNWTTTEDGLQINEGELYGYNADTNKYKKVK
jgi:hypothetical protein